MKKLFYIMFLALPFVWSACADLEEHPIGLLSPQSFFNNKADGEAIVMGAYAGMAGYQDYGNDVIAFVGVRDDQFRARGNNADIASLDNIVPTTANNSKSREQWMRIYSEISAANCAIDGIPRIPADKITEADRKALIAEAKVLRAFNYFRLVRLFGAVPYIDYFVTDPTSVSKVTKTPTAEIYTKIIADLEASKDLLPNTYDGSGPIRSRISKGTAYTVLADVYLTRQNWTKAAESARYVIAHKADFGYELLPDFKDLFNFYAGNDTKEYIWSVDESDTDNGYDYGRDQIAAATAPIGGDWNGYGAIYSTPEALNEFDNADYRKKISFFTEAPYGGIMKNWTQWATYASPACAKYFRSFIGTNKQSAAIETKMNVIVYRYAEVLLIAAEAENEANGPAAAYQYINQVRARARNYDGIAGSSAIPADLSGLDKDGFRTAVILERKFELAFEFKRWFDITRLHLIAKGVFGPTGTDPHSVANTPTAANELIPIPQTEVNMNPNLALPVN